MNQPKSNIPTPKASNCATIPTDSAVTEHSCQSTPASQEDKRPDPFDATLSEVIEKTLKRVLGKTNTHTIYKRLKKNGYNPNEIPANPNVLSTELRNILGSGKGQVAGAASILEQTILENFCAELKTERCSPYSAPFAANIKKLRQTYNKECKDLQPLGLNDSQL